MSSPISWSSENTSALQAAPGIRCGVKRQIQHPQWSQPNEPTGLCSFPDVPFHLFCTLLTCVPDQASSLGWQGLCNAWPKFWDSQPPPGSEWGASMRMGGITAPLLHQALPECLGRQDCVQMVRVIGPILGLHPPKAGGGWAWEAYPG